jgi:uncharacterized protein (UPF0333 family)
MRITKNKKGQTDSVFKLALVVIIIAAVLAVVAYMMGSAWGGTTEIKSGSDAAAATVVGSTDCLVGGAGCDAIAPDP